MTARLFPDAADDPEFLEAEAAIEAALFAADADPRTPVMRFFHAARDYRAGILDDEAVLTRLRDIGLAVSVEWFTKGLELGSRELPPDIRAHTLDLIGALIARNG